jgi:Family of unknown function (DUF5681)
MKKKSKARGASSRKPAKQDTKPSYVVGYGKPPVHSRFVPGRSGNPRGRPKGQLNLETALKNELNRSITIREGDRTRRLKKGVAWLVRIVNGALNNDPKANATLVALLRTLVLDQQPQAAMEAPVTTNDQALLADYLQRHGDLDDPVSGNGAADSPQSRDSKKAG